MTIELRNHKLDKKQFEINVLVPRFNVKYGRKKQSERVINTLGQTRPGKQFNKVTSINQITALVDQKFGQTISF